MQRRTLQKRGMHHTLMHERLQPMQQGFTGGTVAFRRLLLEQCLKIRRTAIGIEAGSKHIRVYFDL
jgi:hypothetical protein